MDTSRDSIVARIKSFVEERQHVTPDDDSFGADVDLFDAGYLDSIGMVELVAFVETTFEIQLEETQLFSDDFTSINGIAGIVADSLGS